MITHTKEYGVYHWDTFDNETFLVKEFNKLEDAEAYVQSRYKGRIGVHGADKVDIVDSKGNVIHSYSVS